MATTGIGFWFWIWSTRLLWTGAGSGLLISILEKLNWFVQYNNTGAIDVKIDGSVLKKNHLLRSWGWLSILNWIGALTLSQLLNLPSRKLEPWFVLWSFFLLRLLCISINLPYSHAWNTVVTSRLVSLVATWDYQISYKNGYVGLLVLHLQRRNGASLRFFFRHYFGRCSSELAHLVPFPYCRGRSTRYSDRLHDFFVTTPRCYKNVYVSSFFPCTAKLWNSLPIQCFPLTYDVFLWPVMFSFLHLNCFKFRINRQFLTVGSF